MHRVQITNGRNPFEYALVSVCATSGVLGLVMPGPGPSANIANTFGRGAPWFYLILMLSSLIVLTGPTLPRRTVPQLCFGMRVERLGLIPLAGADIAYGAANLIITGRGALIAGLLIGGIGLAALIRAKIITTDLRKLDDLLTLDESSRRQPP